jgi:hypothetical protein
VAQRLIIAEEERGTIGVGAHQLVAQRVELALQQQQDMLPKQILTAIVLQILSAIGNDWSRSALNSPLQQRQQIYMLSRGLHVFIEKKAAA